MNSNLESSGAIRNAIRAFSAFLDRPIYWLLGIVYQIFFNVASADVFSNATVMRFYGRIQLILGVYMLFQLAMTIIRGIVDPDNFIEGKNNGGGLIYRILISLTLFSLLIPINTSKSNEYERQINNNGILFGTLYSLQNRILLNNTLGKLVLGTTDGGTYMDTGTNANNMQIAAKRFTTTVVKGFYRVNLLPDKEDPSIVSNRVCQDADSSKMIRNYQSESVDAGDVISLVNETCITDESNFTAYLGRLGDITGNKKYVFAYTPFLPAIVGAIFVFLIVSLTIDIAVRAVKLVILRMIAPIPIISYMDPKGSKDGAFNAWIKSLTGTYLDLFIRLATMYFILFIIQEMIVNGVVINNDKGAVGLLSIIFIWIGLFVFAKEAPKFIREALGLKGEGGKLFGGLGQIIGIGGGALAAAGGTIGSAAANYRASKEENEALHEGQIIRNRFRNVGSAIVGGIAGGAVGLKTLTEKDADAKKVLAAQSQRNAQRAAHSTLPGRIGSDLYGMFTGRSLATRDQGILDANKEASSAIKAFKSMAVDEAKQKGRFGMVTNEKDRTGHLRGKGFNYARLSQAMQGKDVNGNFDYEYEVLDAEGRGTGVTRTESFHVSWFDTTVMADLEDSQTANYLRANYNSRTQNFDNGKIATEWSKARYAMGEAGIQYRGEYLGDIHEGPGTNMNEDGYAYGDIGAKIGQANTAATEMATNMRNIMNRANSQGKK